MSQGEHDSFPKDVGAKLGTYVYRLIDPRNGETFYVGKGKGDRVFAHIRAEPGIEGDELDNKLKRIRDIRLAGFEVDLGNISGLDRRSVRRRRVVACNIGELSGP